MTQNVNHFIPVVEPRTTFASAPNQAIQTTRRIPAIGTSGCIKDKNCNVIVHGTKSGTSIKWEIGAIPSSWMYVGFSKNVWKWSGNNIPMDEPIMEMWDVRVSSINDSLVD